MTSMNPFRALTRACRAARLPCLSALAALLLFTVPCAAQEGAMPEPAPPPISGAEAIEMMKQAMRARGLTPPSGSGLTLEDYIQTGTNNVAPAKNDHDGRYVRLWIGPDGNIVPDPDWQKAHPTYCKQQARYMRGGESIFNLKLFRISDRYASTFPQFIDAGTRKIQEQHTVEGTTLGETFHQAWERMNTPIGAPVEPCGEVRVVHEEGASVGDDFVFFAGFEGSYGRYLDYTWDFGDGSAPVSVGQRARHTYNANGTYEVSVQVDGEHMEPATGSVTVNVGGELTLYFSSRTTQTAPEGYHQVSRYEAEIPLARVEGSTYEGTAALRNTEYTHTMLSRLSGGMGSCKGVTRDGRLHARVVLPAGEPGSTEGIETWLAPPDTAAIPGADLVCNFQGTDMKMPNFGGTWWPIFVVLHGEEGAMGFDFNEWQPSTDPGVIARAVHTGSRTEGGSTMSAETTMEIRGRVSKPGGG